MLKPFLTYDKQIEKLVNEKGLIINDIEDAKKKLIDIGYFSLIGGYKAPFKDAKTHKYIDTEFNDIYTLYEFDRNFKELVFKYICEIELKIRQLISYSFCDIYGEKQSEYLNINNYSSNAPKRKLKTLIDILDGFANKNTDHEYLIHHRKVYHNVPLWIIMNALTIGQTSKLYSFSKPQVQTKISKMYAGTNEGELDKYLMLITLYRNVCAHNERLYCYRPHDTLNDTIILTKMNIEKDINSQYIYGKNDIFGLIIIFKYLLQSESFKYFIDSLKKLISAYQCKSKRIPEKELYNIMGLPDNWYDILKVKI